LRKVYWQELPKWGNGKNKGQINWRDSINHKVKFIYDDVEGEFEIVNYNINKKQCETIFNGKKVWIQTSSIKKGRISFIIGKKTSLYKYKPNDIIKTNNGEIQIIETLKIKGKREYKYKCLKDGFIGTISEYHLNDGNGCPVCSNKKTLKGVNDIATTNPELLIYFANIEDAYKYTKSSSKEIKLICKDCQHEKNIRIDTFYNYGIMCNKCSDGKTYPEKFMFNVLEQLQYKFIPQLTKATFKWCDNYRYDFYIDNINCIIETHGIQHYKETKGIWDKLQAIQENDKIKEQLAIENNIKNYIVLDCRKSDLDWIKNSIMKRDQNNPNQQCLAEILNFKEEDINWLKCHEFACNSLVKVVCDYWNSGIESTVNISKILNMHNSTIRKYLKQGTKLDLCNYDAKKEVKRTLELGHGHNKRKIVQLTVDGKFLKEWDCIKTTSEKINVHQNGIVQCCKGKYKTSGGYKWMYKEDYDDYIEQQNKSD